MNLTNQPTFPMPGKLAKMLRSRKYRKARGTLGRSNNYRCCLGVGAEMALGRELTEDERERSFPVYIGVSEGWLNENNGKGESHRERLLRYNDEEAGWGLVISYLESLQTEMDKEAATKETL